MPSPRDLEGKPETPFPTDKHRLLDDTAWFAEIPIGPDFKSDTEIDPKISKKSVRNLLDYFNKCAIDSDLIISTMYLNSLYKNTNTN